MPICMRDGFDTKNNKNETFRDDEEVFFCETTMQIFRDYEDYFRHVMVINSTVWQCEITGRENLTYSEAVKSERHARKKMEMFKDSLRPMVMLLIDQAKQSSYKALNAIIWKFLRKRYFFNEEVAASHKSTNHKEYKVLEIIPPGKAAISDAVVYEDTEQFQYKLSRKDPKSGKEEVVTVPYENMRRQRFELTTDNLHMFIKHNVVRVDGLLRPKPESHKKYVTDRKITYSTMFIGQMPHFTPAKIKKQVNMTDYLIKGGAPSTAAMANGKDKNGKQSAEAIKKREQEKAEKAEAKKASLKEEMERLRREKQEKLAEMEREKAEKRAQLNAIIDAQCDQFLIKSDDLERTDQRLLPSYTPVKTLLPAKLIGDAFMLREFLQSFVGVLSGAEVFRGNFTFLEMCRAFTQREVAGPLSDILIVLLSTIFDLQREEDDESEVKYLKSRSYFKHTDIMSVMLQAGKTHTYVRRHYCSKVNELPVDALTLSEVLRLHLLFAGAKVNERTEKWRNEFRNGYKTSEDPGLHFRLQYPHILRALRQYTVYHLPFLDIMRIMVCLVDQILTYSTVIALIDERNEQMNKAKTEMRNMTLLENRRQFALQGLKRTLNNEHNQLCMDDNVKNDAEKKRQLEEKLNKKMAELLAKSEREQRKYEQQMKKYHTAIFNFLVYLGTDRAYRRYYVLESMPGLFIEHSDQIFEEHCLQEPPSNAMPTGLTLDVANLPKNRKDLRAYLLRMHTEQERKDKAAALAPKDPTAADLVDPKKESILTSSQEDKENQENGLRSSISNGHDKKLTTPKMEVDGADSASSPQDPTQTELYMCSGDKNDCIVHNDRHPNRKRWSYIYEKEDINALIEALNPLGHRESMLRDQLTLLKTLILTHVQQCPFDYLSLADKQMQKMKNVMVADTHRKYSKANFGFPEGTDINEVMQSALVEHILKFEADIYSGDLGSLKVKNMEKWRNDLINNSYDPQGKLQWGSISADEMNGHKDNGDDDTGDEETEQIVDTNHYVDPGEELGNTMEIDTDDSGDEEISLHDSDTIKEHVKSLASALLQVEQGIQRRFIKEPFGTPLKETKDKELLERKIKEGAEQLKQWEISLMESNSYSQVFLHLNVLHDCIIWARSTNKSYCQVCRRGSDPDQMLLCDECNGGTHMFCMKPKMTTVPEGNWYCKQCCKRLGLKNESDEIKKNPRTRKPAFVIDEEDNRSDTSSTSSRSAVGVRSSQRRNKKRMRSIEIEDMLEEDDDNEDDDDNNEEANGDDEGIESEEDEDDRVNGQNATDYDEDESQVDDDDPMEEDDEIRAGQHKKIKHVNGDQDSEDDEEEENVCVVCSYEGGDVTCASCKDSFHLECVNLKRTPRSFTCTKCKASEDRKRKNKPNGKHSMDDSGDDDEVLETSAKRTRRSRNFSNGIANTSDTQKTHNSRRSNRRTGDQLPLNSATLYELLDDVMKHEQAWPFLRPVSQAEVPDYYKIIKSPMDFAKVKSKLNMGKYQLNEEVLNDIQLVFNNCDEYNVKGNEIYKAGCELERFVIERCKDLSLPFKPSDMNE